MPLPSAPQPLWISLDLLEEAPVVLTDNISILRPPQFEVLGALIVVPSIPATPILARPLLVPLVPCSGHDYNLRDDYDKAFLSLRTMPIRVLMPLTGSASIRPRIMPGPRLVASRAGSVGTLPSASWRTPFASAAMTGFRW